jgi:methionyl-tRNA synthetase
LSAEGEVCAPERELCEQAERTEARVTAAFETLALHEAVTAVPEFIKDANRYLQATAPWDLARTGDARRLGVVLRHALEAASRAAGWYAPIIPRAAAEASRRLSATPPEVGAPLFPRYSC